MLTQPFPNLFQPLKFPDVHWLSKMAGAKPPTSSTSPTPELMRFEARCWTYWVLGTRLKPSDVKRWNTPKNEHHVKVWVSHFFWSFSIFLKDAVRELLSHTGGGHSEHPSHWHAQSCLSGGNCGHGHAAPRFDSRQLASKPCLCGFCGAWKSGPWPQTPWLRDRFKWETVMDARWKLKVSWLGTSCWPWTANGWSPSRVKTWPWSWEKGQSLLRCAVLIFWQTWYYDSFSDTRGRRSWPFNVKQPAVKVPRLESVLFCSTYETFLSYHRTRYPPCVFSCKQFYQPVLEASTKLVDTNIYHQNPIWPLFCPAFVRNDRPKRPFLQMAHVLRDLWRS